MPRNRNLVAATTVVALVAGVGAAQLLPGAAPVARADGLIPFTSCEDLLDHYRDELRASATSVGFDGGWGVMEDAGGTTAMSASGGEAARTSADSVTAVGVGSTGTNLQEQGVDEPDLAKLRDGRIVLLARNRVQVLSAEAEPRVLGSLPVGDDSAYGPDVYWDGGELLLVGDRALVIVPGWREKKVERSLSDDRSRVAFSPGTPTTRLLLVDLSTDQPRLIEEATYTGQYVSARLVDGTVRLVTTTRPQLPFVYPMTADAPAQLETRMQNRRIAESVTLADVLPQVERRDADGTVLERGPALGCSGVSHAKAPRGMSTLTVTTMRPAAGLESTDDTAVTTDGDLVYAAPDRLYVATSRWGTVMPLDDAVRGVAATDEVSTELHAFDTSSSTSTRYLGSGEVPGYVLGRWALSLHEGDLRVATTRQPPWEGDQSGETSSMVVKLAERDGALVETGRVGGLGKTEQIRAVRYFGDIAAVVTFRQTDPLYLLDLADEPKVLGELKIPGFSTYLHPLGDGLLLGVGQDATDQGQVTGMQLSVFDISDLTAPTQVDRLSLGEGWSPALEDSRAFSYDPQRRLAVLPFMGYDSGLASSSEPARLPASGTVGVTVGEDGSLSEAGLLPMDQDAYAMRSLIDSEHVFAVTDGKVVAGDLDTMQETGQVSLAG